MQIHTEEKPIFGNNLHISVYGCEIKKEMSPTAHCVYILKKCLWLMLVCCFLKCICETFLSTSHSFSKTSVTFDCCLHQRTTLNSVQSLKLQRCRYVFIGFNRTHLIMLTISIITAGQLNVNSWLSMLLGFIGIEYNSYQNSHGFNWAK